VLCDVVVFAVQGGALELMLIIFKEIKNQNLRGKQP